MKKSLISCGSWNKSLISCFIWSKLLDIALLTVGSVWLYVNTSGILIIRFFLISPQRDFFCPNSILSIIYCCLYPVSINLLRTFSQLSWNSLVFEEMRRRHKACANGMLCFKGSGYSDLGCKGACQSAYFLQSLVLSLPDFVL